MKYRKLTELGDYSFGNNSQDYISGVDAIAQAIKTKILLFYGEWWEDLGLGIPMIQSILGKTNPESVSIVLNTLLADRIKEVKLVDTVDSIEAEANGRNLKVTVHCTTVDENSVVVEVTL